MKRIIIFGSGSGSNFEAIAKAIKEESLPIEILYVFSENPDAYILERAKRLGIPSKVIDYKKTGSRKEFNRKVFDMLKESEPFDLLVLAGYMKILPTDIVKRYYGKIINIHPALLPSFPGLHAIERAFRKGVKVTGVTVHFVDEGVDTGPIIAQVPVEIEEDDTLETLEEKIHRVEHQLYIEVIKELLGLKGEVLKRRYALLTVSDKRNLEEFAKDLIKIGYRIIATGGTGALLKKAGVPFTSLERITGFKEILKGKVKTLHPRVFGGVLFNREGDGREVEKFQIPPIEILAVNFYPLRRGKDFFDSIDIGGPALLRASIKNSRWVTPIVDPDDYGSVINSLKEKGKISDELKKRLLLKAIRYLTDYHIQIEKELSKFENKPGEKIYLSFKRERELRYGENPHQRGWIYRGSEEGFLSNFELLSGKDLSYTNIIDMESGLDLLFEFEEPAAVIIKHTNPCGVATSKDIEDAFMRAFDSDPLSAFGGVFLLNREVPSSLLDFLSKHFFDTLIAPSFAKEIVEFFKDKKSRRIVKYRKWESHPLELRFISGGLLLQEKDLKLEEDFVVYGDPLKREEIEEIIFSLKVVRHVKSNAIVVVKDFATVGIGAGQQSRVDAVKIALGKAGDRAEGAILTSDAFFPFPDSVEIAKDFKIKTIVQPGGSKRDKEVIETAQKYGIRMVLTGIRHFRH
jgi:phosphoribosylaminoimidazolecarboxamide formyltransferase/IMP cyclohydrolase